MPKARNSKARVRIGRARKLSASASLCAIKEYIRLREPTVHAISTKEGFSVAERAKMYMRFKELDFYEPGSTQHNDITRYISKKLFSKEDSLPEPHCISEWNTLSQTEGGSEVSRLRTLVISGSFPDDTKRRLLADISQAFSCKSDDKHKRISWVRFVCSLSKMELRNPLSTMSITDIYTRISDRMYGHHSVIESVIESVSDYLSSLERNVIGRVIGLCGPPGVGKTEMARVLSDCLGLPVIFIALGGAHDASKLIGHSLTYSGSVPGEIAVGMARHKVANAIIFLDEIDKVSARNGGEIDGVLMHLIDSTQNDKFVDEYVGFPIDLSRCLFMLSFNDISKVNRIVLDRINVIQVPGYKTEDKLNILRDFIIPVHACPEIIVTDAAQKTLVSVCSHEQGVRDLKRLTQKVYSQCCLYLSTGRFFIKDIKTVDVTSSEGRLIVTEELVHSIIKDAVKQPTTAIECIMYS